MFTLVGIRVPIGGFVSAKQKTHKYHIKTNKNQQCKDFFVNNSFIKKDNHYLFDLNNLKNVKNNFFKVKYGQN